MNEGAEEVTSWIDLTTPYTGDVSRPHPAACLIRSPSGVMECVLPFSYGLSHSHGQHLGVDRNGNYRGWRDTRLTTL